MRIRFILLSLTMLLFSCGKNMHHSNVNATNSKLFGDTLWEGDNLTSPRRTFHLGVMFHGRVVSVSKAFESCVKRAVSTGWSNIGPYNYCKDDPKKGLSKSAQALAALKVARNFSNIKVKYEPDGTGNAHHHGNGGYGNVNEYFHWSGWFAAQADRMNLKVCRDSAFCTTNPGHRDCGAYTRSDNRDGPRCKWEAYPFPFSQGAGIAWHEVMHHHTYKHGTNEQATAPNACGTASIPGWHYQKNTMPYIVGDCISKVMETSQRVCGNIKVGSIGLKLITDINATTCETVLDPKRKGIKLTIKHTGKCVDVQNNSTGNRANIWQYSCNNTGAQRWNLERAQGEYFRIVNRTSGKCLDVQNSSRSDGGNVFQQTCHQGLNQQWELIPAGNNYFELKARHSGKCLDVLGFKRNNGANITQYTCYKRDNQLFKISGLYHSKEIGGNYGDRFFQESKPYFTGYFGRYGSLIDKVGFLDNRRLVGKTFGGTGGRSFSYQCPGNSRMVGVTGRAGARIDSLAIICSDLTGRSQYTSPLKGGTGGSPFSFKCAKGFWVKKIEGLGDRFVNRLTIHCGR